MEGPPFYLLLPLLAGVVFASGSLCLKRAFLEGAGVGQTFLLNHLVLGLVFSPLLLVAPATTPWHLWYLPVLTGLAFFAGQATNYLAVSRGDVSLVTPLLGTKTIFVVAAGWLLFRHGLSLTHWLAALLTAAGVFAMGVGELRPGRNTLWSAALALISSAGFGCCDALIQEWAGRIGLAAFMGLLFGTVAVLSLVVIPSQGRALLRSPRSSWRWLGMAVAFSATQSVLITVSIARWHDATGVNVVYSLRGLWSIGLVWVVGHWFGNTEHRAAGTRIMTARLAGALLILAAVVLVVVVR